MGIDVSRLSPWAQKQIAQKIAIAETAKRFAKEVAQEKEEGKTKLRNKKCPGFLMDGTQVMFDSQRERDRYGELALMAKAGQISDLRYQVKYELIPPQVRDDGTKERGISYTADFVYEQDGKTVVEDSKGYRNPASATYAKFVMKRKLMLYIHGITVMEV